MITSARDPSAEWPDDDRDAQRDDDRDDQRDEQRGSQRGGESDSVGDRSGLGAGVAPSSSAPRRWRAWSRVRWLALGAFAGLLLGCVGSLLLIRTFQSPAPPPLTDEAWQTAWDRWQEHGSDDYRLELQVEGASESRVAIEVRDGVAASLAIDGQQPRRTQSWDYWTVPGIFDVMRTDLDHAQNPRQAFGVDDPGQVVLQAEFDAERGYPIRYRRVVMGGRGGVQWDVVRLKRCVEAASHSRISRPASIRYRHHMKRLLATWFGCGLLRGALGRSDRPGP